MLYDITHRTTYGYGSDVSVSHHLAHLQPRELRSQQVADFRLLVEPDLSVLIFERVGWGPEEYDAWSHRLLADQFAFVTPTRHRGRVCTRFAIVNPQTTPEDLAAIIATMR